MNLYAIKYQYTLRLEKTILVLADSKKQAKIWGDAELFGKSYVIQLVKDVPLPIKIQFFSTLKGKKK